MTEYDMMPHEQASTLMLVEPLIATGKTETGVVVAGNGSTSVFRGTKNHVKMGTDDVAGIGDSVEDVVMVHNHPICASLSSNDIEALFGSRWREMRVVCVLDDGWMRIFRLRFKQPNHATKKSPCDNFVTLDFWEWEATHMKTGMKTILPKGSGWIKHEQVVPIWKVHTENMRRLAASKLGRKHLLYGEFKLRHDVMCAFARECGGSRILKAGR